MMDALQEIIQDNSLGNKALRKFVEALSPRDLAAAMEAGWTVSAVLMHLVFWDQRAITLIEKWKKEGVGDSAIDTDVINETTRRLCLAIPPTDAAAICLQSIDAIDRLIAELTPAMVEAIQTRGKTVRLNRADHRRTHLVEMERAVQATRQAGK
jgi:hypothetical protein